MVGFDEYDRKARLTPGLLGVAPIPVLVTTLGLREYPAIAIASAVVVEAGAAYLLAVLVRHLGRQLEGDLWSSWGGPPTTRLLRLREPSANPVERDLWRAALQGLTKVKLLGKAAEARQPALADQTIEAAVSQVLRLGQGSERYPLVHAENIQYGFERNLWGVRWVGRVISLVCVATLLAVLLADGTNTISTGAVAAGALIGAVFAVGWILVPSSDRARLASERYARLLLQAVVAEDQKSHGGQDR